MVYELKVLCGPLDWVPLVGRDEASQLCTISSQCLHSGTQQIFLEGTAHFPTVPDAYTELHKRYGIFFSLIAAAPLCLLTTLKVFRETIFGHTVKMIICPLTTKSCVEWLSQVCLSCISCLSSFEQESTSWCDQHSSGTHCNPAGQHFLSPGGQQPKKRRFLF